MPDTDRLPAVTSRHAGGRPRETSLDARILEATIDLLGEVGYQALSMAGVAARAGVGRPALYRRFRSKPDLVIAAIASLSAPAAGELPRDPRQAIRDLLSMTASALARPGAGTILGSLLAQEDRDPELLAAFRERFFDPRRALVRDILETGLASGALRPGLDVEAVDAILFGALLAPRVLGRPTDGTWVDRTLDLVWPALAGNRS